MVPVGGGLHNFRADHLKSSEPTVLVNSHASQVKFQMLHLPFFLSLAVLNFHCRYFPPSSSLNLMRLQPQQYLNQSTAHSSSMYICLIIHIWHPSKYPTLRSIQHQNSFRRFRPLTFLLKSTMLVSFLVYR